MRHIVETRTGNSWENTWTDDGVPCVFESRSAARAALDELLEEMPDYAERDYRIVRDPEEYDAVEVHPVAREVIDGVECFEQCDRDFPDIHYWSVYLHMKEGGISCIADCPTEEVANFIADAVEKVL
jgi:hypothetical protein